MDPNLPIRGRYVRPQVLVPAPGLSGAPAGRVRLVVRKGLVEAIDPGGPRPGSTKPLPATIRSGGGGAVAQLGEALAFFLPPQVPDPSRRPQGERLRVEVTLPPRGSPRPIRLGVTRQEDGAIEPLRLR